jgi:4-amino-4-deoxy-L-arabinose transferase-like glycosyltransferase
LIICGIVWSRTSPRPLTEFDQTFYIGIAYDLRHAGRFTNGFVFADEGPGRERGPGMRFAPLYPAFAAAVAAWDAPFANSIDCIVQTEGKDASCPEKAGLMRLAQCAFLITFFWLVWWIAGEVLNSPRGAWIALGLALLSAPQLFRFVNYVMTEITALVMLAAAIASAVAAVRGRPMVWLFAAGVFLGLTALTRPAFLYLAFAAVLVGFGLVACRRPRLAKAGLLLAFVIGAGAAVLPWVARNAIVLGKPALSHGYASHTLVQRIAYNQMSWTEYGLFFVCELPDGRGLARLLSGPGACNRFSWQPTQKDAFNTIGNTTLMAETVTAAGGWSNHLSYLVSNYILRDPIKHMLVTIPFTLAGAWVNHYWGLVLGIACLVLTVRALREGHTRLLVVTLPAWFMLIFHAAVAVNQPRYNLILILPYSIAGAWLIDAAVARARLASARLA